MQMNAMILLCTVAPVMAMLRGTGQETLLTDMQPEVVRKLLNNVEQKWIHTRAMVLSNVTDNEDAFSAMEKSCVKVSSAIVAGSEGQKDRVTEYMQDVCAVDGADKGLCASFASGIAAVMSDDSEFNRDNLQLSQFCRKFWESAVTSAAQEEAKELAEKEEAAKEKEAAEEATKEKEEKAAAEEEAKVKAYESQEASKTAEAAKTSAEDAARVKAYEEQQNWAQTNKTSVAPQAPATATPVETAQANSTVAQPSSNVEQTNSSVQMEQTNSSGKVEQANSSVAPAAPEAPAASATSTKNATSAAVAETIEKKTNSTSVAMTADKNATVAKKK